MNCKTDFVITDSMLRKYVHNLLPTGANGDLLKSLLISDLDKTKEIILDKHPEMNLEENWNKLNKKEW